MKVINQAIGRGNASDGSPRAHWKAVRRPMVFAAVALALLLIAAAGAGNNSAGDIAAAGVIGAVVGYFLLRMLAQGSRRTHFEYADGRPAYPNRTQPNDRNEPESANFMSLEYGFRNGPHGLGVYSCGRRIWPNDDT